MKHAAGPKLLKTGEVAKMFRVDPRTVAKWAKSNRIASIRLPSGHRRFNEDIVRALLKGSQPPPEESEPAPAMAP